MYRCVALVCLIGALVGPLKAGASDSTILAREDRVSSTALVEATAFRESFHLRADAAYVSSAAYNTVAFPDDLFGVPLSAAEATELQRRIDVQTKLGPAKRLAATMSGFAGTYLDHARSGEPVFLFTGGTPTRRADLSTVIPPGMSFHVETADRSFADLLSVKEQVRGRLEAFTASGIQIRTLGIDVKNNTVSIGVADVARATEVMSDFDSRVDIYPERAIAMDACTTVSLCHPFRGGIHIWETSSGQPYCTSGFMMKRTSPTPIKYAILTAGHCIGANGGVGETWKHTSSSGSQLIGAAAMHTWYANEYADAGVIWIDNAPLYKNWFVADNSPWIPEQELSYVTPIAEQTVGDTACRMGMVSGMKCGNITKVNVDNINVDGEVIQDLIEIGFDSKKGDSGGPVFTGGAGLGTHSDSTFPDSSTGKSWYTTLTRSKDSLYIRHGVVFKYCIYTDCWTN